MGVLTPDLKKTQISNHDRLPTTNGSAVRQRLVVVGMGMAGFALVDRLDRAGALSHFDVTMIGDEPSLPYDRVNLSKLFEGASESDLLLASEHWYRDREIRLSMKRRVTAVDRSKMTVRDNTGQDYRYDKLVLATGSHAWVPPMEGADQEGVFVYRTLDDLEHIKHYVDERNCRLGAVIGGGLLGLEAAKILAELGLQTSVIEMAPGLMPRQLDSDGAGLLKEAVEAIGVDVQLVRRTKSIESTASGQLNIQFFNADDHVVDILVIAAGIRPNDQLADVCGLEKGPRGGFVVDGELATTDPNIFAVGECASFNDHVFGLVAPCYRMADVLSERLAGKETVFTGADESAELKLLGVQVATLGQSIGEVSGIRQLTHQDEDGYRKVLIRRGRVVGASCVGPWPELPQVRQAINRQAYLWPWQQTRFERTGSPWAPGGALPVHEWPGESVVCSCLGVTKQTIVETVAALGGPAETDVACVSKTCGASTACGSCRNLVAELSGGKAEKVVVPGTNTMLVASTIALLGFLAIPIALLFLLPDGFAQGEIFAKSVQDSWREVDVLWRSDFARQVTGFSLLGVTAVGMLFSLRKRIPKFQFASYGAWRAMHGVLGTVALFAVVVHTGLRLGTNLNMMLGLCFFATILLGGFAGLGSALESRASGPASAQIRLWRGRLAKIHLWVTWPLPILIALHVFSFYWFSD